MSAGGCAGIGGADGTQSIVDGIALATGCSGVAVDARSPLPVTLDVDEPLTVGADRIVNVPRRSSCFDRRGGGRLRYRDHVRLRDGRCRGIGGAIMPGLRTSADQLTRRAAKLPATELRPPARVIGRRTEECIQAGALFGAADAVDDMIRRTSRNGQATPAPGRGHRWTGVHRCSADSSIELTDPDLTSGDSDRGRTSRSGVVSWPRRAGYRLLGSRLDYLLHTRPAEWPIVAAHTTLGYLLAGALPTHSEASGWGVVSSGSRCGSSA